MGLELRRGRKGDIRRHWYGRMCGRVVNLNVPIEGTPPPSGRIKDAGDAAFETSRAEAQREFLKARAEARHKGRAENLTELLIESKTGRAVVYVKVTELAERWRKLPRETEPSADWLSWCDTVFSRFAEAVPCRYLHEVTPDHAAAYVGKLRDGYARRTARGAETMLKGAFSRFLPPGACNPFVGAINRKGEDTEGDTVNRRPFTADELQRLFDAARDDAFLYPLVVTAACTGLRRGDVCRLKWQAVDLRAGVVAVKTAKTGAVVEIPIFGPLRGVLETALADRRVGAKHVFPQAVHMVTDNPDGLTWRFKKLVCSIIQEPTVDAKSTGAEVAREDLSEHMKTVTAAVSAGLDGDKRERVIDTLSHYASGQSVRDIEKATGRPRSSVSADLHTAERLSGVRFMPTPRTGEGAKERVARLTRSDGLSGRARRASILDWHALRVSWVTLALSAGVPMEVCRLVTGHKTVEIVMKHYFKPGREHLRAILSDKLPRVLTGHAPAAIDAPIGPLAEIEAKLGELSKTDRRRLTAMLKRST